MDPLCAAKELAALVEKEAQKLGLPVTFALSTSMGMSS
jgi:hypothetical protein